MQVSIDLRFAHKAQVKAAESIPLVVTLRVEQKIFADALDISEFLKSLTETGLRPLFTCKNCGTFGCGGYYVEIEHSEEYYIINGSYQYLRPHESIDTTRYDIPWWQMQKLVKQLRDAIASIPHHHDLENYVGTGWLPSLDDLDAAINLINVKTHR
jgi:hypothetical protein